MSESRYGFKYDEYGNTREILVYDSGISVHSCSFINKGTGFTMEERGKLGLYGCLPPGIRNLQDQVRNSAKTVESKKDNIEKYIFLRSLFDRNVTLAHALIGSDLKKYIRLIYAPTVGDAVRKYSSMFRQANGLHFYPGNIDNAENILRRFLHRDIRVAVVTDNQGVLGIGDQGAGGIAVCLGKLMIYSQGAGIAPWHCLPISLDVGTDNEKLLDDDQYLGWRHERLKGEEYLSFIGRFTRAFRNVFPNALLQWEDFSGQNAFSINDAFSEEIISFNDDIQGSGAVVLAALLNSVKKKGGCLKEQKILIYGTGPVSVGIAKSIELYLKSTGIDGASARKNIYIMDGNGLVSSKENRDMYLGKFVQEINMPEAKRKNLGMAINETGASILVLAETEGAQVTVDDIKALIENDSDPVVINLSCDIDTIPNELNEIRCQAIGMQNRKTTQSSLVRRCHNGLIFPGIGLGVLASGARRILPECFIAAAETVAGMVPDSDLREGKLLPDLNDIPEVSENVALSVAMKSVEKNVSRSCVYSDFQHMNDETRMRELIDRMRWKPKYLSLVAM